MTTGSFSSSSNTSAATSPRRPSSSSAASPQACAACKYQRRKCKPDCTLAPFFPASQQRQFLNAHRLFGVRNILKIIRHLDPVQRAEAMRSIIFQSNARAHDPIGGCHRIILELESQLQRDSAELALVRRQLAIFRSQALADPNLPLDIPPDVDDEGGGDGAVYDSRLLQPMHRTQQQYCNYSCYDGGGRGEHNANNIFLCSTDRSKNYRDGGITGAAAVHGGDGCETACRYV